MKLPSTRSTLIVLAAAVVIGFFGLEEYVARLGLVWNAMNQNIDLGSYIVPYRWFLASCVGLAAGRLLIGERKTRGE